MEARPVLSCMSDRERLLPVSDVWIKEMRRKTKFRVLLVFTLCVFCILMLYQNAPRHHAVSEVSDISVVSEAEVHVQLVSVDANGAKRSEILLEAKRIVEAAEKSEDVEKAAKLEAPLAQNSVTVLFMEGWVDFPDFYNSDFSIYLDFFSPQLCGCLCRAFRTGESRFSAADVVVFQPSALTKEPPRKYPKQIWILHSFFELEEYDFRHIRQNAYTELIDYYLIRPENVLTPLLFNKDISFLVDRGFEAEIKIMKYYNAHPVFNVVQMVRSCTLLPSTDRTGILSHALASQFKEKHSKVGVYFVTHCYGTFESFSLPANATFAVLDNSSCHNAMLDQFIKTLSFEDAYVIPVIPPLSSSDLLHEFQQIAPPRSFISANDFNNNLDSLVHHLNEVVSNTKLYRSYHAWRGKYTLNTEAGESYFSYFMI